MERNHLSAYAVERDDEFISIDGIALPCRMIEGDRIEVCRFNDSVYRHFHQEKSNEIRMTDMFVAKQNQKKGGESKRELNWGRLFQQTIISATQKKKSSVIEMRRVVAQEGGC
jgi:hypothetical protein